MQCCGEVEIVGAAQTSSFGPVSSSLGHVTSDATNDVTATDDSGILRYVNESPAPLSQSRRRRARRHHKKRIDYANHPAERRPPPPSSSVLRRCEDQVQSATTTLFVGQLPTDVAEHRLKSVFGEFGRVAKLKIHRDKLTGENQRCCFVTFDSANSAQKAIRALHNVRRLPGMQYPLQVKLADCSNNSCQQRKLFIGMISKDLSENDLIEMFARFGDIDECTIVREPGGGPSTGCALLTFADKQAAAAAIRSMHRSQSMQGCALPITVKLADTRPTKILKRLRTRLLQSHCPSTDRLYFQQSSVDSSSMRCSTLSYRRPPANTAGGLSTILPTAVSTDTTPLAVVDVQRLWSWTPPSTSQPPPPPAVFIAPSRQTTCIQLVPQPAAYFVPISGRATPIAANGPPVVAPVLLQWVA